MFQQDFQAKLLASDSTGVVVRHLAHVDMLRGGRSRRLRFYLDALRCVCLESMLILGVVVWPFRRSSDGSSGGSRRKTNLVTGRGDDGVDPSRF